MNYIIEKDQYLNVLAIWKQTKNHTSAAHIIYNVLRGFDPKRGFSPITKATKLANGAQEWGGYGDALYGARSMTRSYCIPSYTFRDEERRQLWITREDTRLKMLQTTFGIEFTLELLNKLQELIK